MGMIGTVFGAGRAARQIGEAVGGVAEVFVGNRAEREAAEAPTREDALAQFGVEFAATSDSRFDGFVDGLNRLPRPLLALGTLGLFGYAMAEPGGFSTRMQSLGLVPEPLWWLLGAVVSFYFGARELHHQRIRTTARAALAAAPAAPLLRTAARPKPRVVDPDQNAAVEEWRRLRR
jgi:hypothetical protein